MPVKISVRPAVLVGDGVFQIDLIHSVCLVSEEDLDRVCCCNWHLKRSHKTCYATGRPSGSTRKDRPVFMHTFLFGVENMCVDHINRNGLDNRRENIRLVSHAENIQNSFIEGKTSKYKGVYWHANRWEVQLSRDRKKVYGGRFKDENDAARHADSIILKVWGRNAATNESLGLLQSVAS